METTDATEKRTERRFAAMDIVKGSLEDISRPAFIPKSRSGSRVSSASLAEKPKLNLAVGSLEVLTPEPAVLKVHPNLSENNWGSADSSFSLSCNELEASSKSGFPEVRDIDRDRRGTSPRQVSERIEYGHDSEGAPPLHPPENREPDQDKTRSRPLQPSENRETDHDKKGVPPLQPSEIIEHDHDKKGVPPLQPSEIIEHGHDKKGEPPLQPSERRETYQDTRIGSCKQHSQMENKLKKTWIGKEGSDVEEHEGSDEENKDPQLVDAIRKMKTLDKILAKKQLREREVKYLSQQMKKKLWEELQSATCPTVLQTHEETLNTRKFMALTPQMQDISAADCVEEDAPFTPVFHTQIPPEEDECQGDHNGLDIKRRIESNELPNLSDEMPHVPRKRNKMKSSKRVDFIKRNIELARDAGNTIVLMDDEKQRIEDLLKDTEDGNSADREDDVSGWLVPGEGYTPEPEEHQQLAKIDAGLQAVLSAEDFSSIHSSHSSIQNQGYQESLTFMNGNLEVGLLESAEEVLPGERALRFTKVERFQQARLKEIDQQLENFEKSMTSPCNSLPSLSEEQLKTLLEECCWSQRSASSNTVLPIADESSASFRAADSPRLSPTVLAELLEDARGWQMDSAMGKPELDARSPRDIKGSKMEGADVKKTTDSRCSSGILTAAAVDMVDESNDRQHMDDNTEVGYFMSRALSLTKLKKPSFLNEPFYCTNITNEAWSQADIPSAPVVTGGDELQVEDLTSI